MDVKFHSGTFEGSFDLLLFLVKKHKMSPLDLKISEITDEFVEYVDHMDKVDIEIASDFILMASTLMEIKSKMLLNPSEEVVEKQGEIAKQLYEYSILKESKQRVETLCDHHSKEFDVSVFSISVQERNEKLPDAFTKIMNAVRQKMNLRKRIYKIKKDLYSFSRRMEMLKSLIEDRKRMSVDEIIGMSNDKLEAVVTFVTVLELLRLNFIFIDSESVVRLREKCASGD